jgi:hypothetical protein
VLRGRRKRVPYENPQGRRVNAIGVLIPHGPLRALWYDAVPRTLTSEDLLAIVEAIPRGDHALVVVLDNASIHRSKAIRAALPRLRRKGIHLYYLPPYSPELNPIEAQFGVIKQTEFPRRSYPTVPALLDAIRAAFTAQEQRLLSHPPQQLRPAA